MDFTLTPEDAASLREIAGLEPAAARSYLQDRPELARRIMGWPPELRLEVCRIIWQSFPAGHRERTLGRKHPGSNLLDLLKGDGA